MRAFHTRAILFLASALLVAATVSAQTTQGLERVGPTSPTNGYPTWYQDKTGITLEFCQPQSAAELQGGWCLLLPGDTTAPEVFPAPFADEHFYWAADASIAGASLNAILVLGLEGAFANGPVINGDQIVFARIRFRFDAPQTGTYRVYHPFGVDVVDAAAGERVFVTEDVGLTCPKGQFDCALSGRLGPFLLASISPGGPELPPVAGPVPGKLYLADPARLGPVTGSPVGQNFFRIEGPGGAILGETSNFSLMGRLFQGAMGGRVTVDRARYSRAVGATQGKVDVFATAFATAQPRLPAAPITPAVTPMLGFFPAACGVGAGGALGAPAGSAVVQMFSAGSRHYGQMLGTVPAAVCVEDFTARDAGGQIVPTFTQKAVTDHVTISEAIFNPASGGSLRVTASSSDAAAPPQLSALGLTFQSGVSIQPIVGVPPVSVRVTSAKGGSAELEVVTLEGQPEFPAVPLAGNDAFTVLEDSGTSILNVLANDTHGGALINPSLATLAIIQAPVLGIARVVGATIVFTPNANAAGNDLLAYTVTVAGVTSPAAIVSLAITNVNDAPVAVNDAANGVGGLAIAVPLLANDTDVDGAADLVGATIVSAPAGVTYTVTGGTLSFTALAGTYTFTYRAKDAAGALSNVATVTVTLAGGETLGLTRVEYLASKRRWRVDGTSSVPANQTVYIMYANGTFADGTTAAGFLIGTTQVAGGVFTLDFTLAGTNDPRNPTSGLFSVRPTAVYATTSQGGSSPVTVLTIR